MDPMVLDKKFIYKLKPNGYKLVDEQNGKRLWLPEFNTYPIRRFVNEQTTAIAIGIFFRGLSNRMDDSFFPNI